MLRVLYVLFFCFLSASMSSQSYEHQLKIDSIRAQLDGPLKPMRRIQKNLRLISLYKYSHPDVDSLIESSLALAEKRDFRFFIARSLKFRARHKLYLGASSESILSDINRIDSIAHLSKNKLIPGWVSRLKLEYYLKVGNLPKSKEYLDLLEVQIKDNKYVDIASFHTFKGMFYQKNREYRKAIDHYALALPRGKAGKSYILNRLAILYLEMNDPERAIYYADTSLTHGALENNMVTHIESTVVKGRAALLLKDTARAIAFLEESESLRKIPHYSKNYSALHDLIDIYQQINPSKVDELMEDLTSYELVESYPLLLVQKGEMYLERSDHKQAELLCKLGLERAIGHLAYKYASRACQCLVDVYKHTGDDGARLRYLEIKMDYQSKVSNENEIISKARNLARFEADKDKALYKQEFEKNKEVLNERISKYKIGGILAILLIALGLYFLREMRIRNKRIDEQNKVINKALTEKDILLREIHHRVKNNLQLVSSMLTLQGRSIDDEVAQQAIIEGQSRVRSMALIHQDLYHKENLVGISVRDYITRLTQELYATYKIQDRNISLVMDIDLIELDIDIMIPLGLIINELLTNSLKYAFPNGRSGSLSVQLKEIDQLIHLTVEDDGIGYDISEVRGNSFGTTLIHSLTAQLEGELISSSSDGTRTEIVFSSVPA